TKIASDLYWAHFELPFRLNHVNLFLMDTPEGILILDAGLKSDHSEEHWEALLNGPLKSKKFAGLLITHYHPDHIGMAGWLQKKLNIKCLTTEKELFTAKTFRSMPDDEYAKLFRNVFVRAGMSEEDIIAKGPATRLYKNRVYELPDFEIIKAGYEIVSNDGKWKVRTDSGHSPEHISLLDKERKLYLSGDFLLPRISPNISDNFFDPLDDRLGEYLKYLNEIQEIGPETSVFPCHDWPFKEGMQRAKDLIKHHNHRLSLIIEALNKKSITIMDSISIIFDRKIGDEQMHFAIGEARAHLIHLDVTGQVRSEVDDRGTVHYNKI
ncbi:MBL fold metallo-hydrolase, partial [Alphaproteobacteria bacterium]|nr:MBL fold metallo-hydrolase [Alphaproteobacteria bacterium]